MSKEQLDFFSIEFAEKSFIWGFVGNKRGQKCKINSARANFFNFFKTQPKAPKLRTGYAVMDYSIWIDLRAYTRSCDRFSGRFVDNSGQTAKLAAAGVL